MMGRNRNAGKPGAKNPGKTFKRIMAEIMGRYKLHCVAVVICLLISAVANVYGTMFMQRLIDDYITPMIGSPDPDFGPMGRAVLGVALVYLLGAFSAWLYNYLMIFVSQGTLKNLRVKLFSKMERLPIKYFDTHAHGDIMSVYTNDIDTMRQMISQSMPQLISSVVTIVSIVTSMIILNVPLLIITLFMVATTMTLSVKRIKSAGRFFVAQQQDLGRVNGYIEEMMDGQKVVKVFCHEQRSIEEFDKINDALFEDSYRAHAYASVLGPIIGNIGNFLYVALALVGGVLLLIGVPNLSLSGKALDISILVPFLNMTKQFTGNINQLSQQINSIVMAGAGAQRVFSLIDEKAETDDGFVTLVDADIAPDGTITESDHHTGHWAWKNPNDNGKASYRELRGDVRLIDVDFGYEPNKEVLHDVSVYAEPGQKVAFVGATGAGKTTITNLINRFYDIADGQILYDGIDVSKIKKADLRRSLGIVLQDVNLFTGTVMDNIRYGKLNATDEECIAAAKLAGADDFITRLPQGYATELANNGANLSQGQRQLISIARAAVADPPVMILDEATSSIDTRTEAIVQRGMDQLMEGRTVFVIAHRLSTVKNSDVIMVLDHGRIIERGSHEKLIAEKGTYYQLYTGAFELE